MPSNQRPCINGLRPPSYLPVVVLAGHPCEIGVTDGNATRRIRVDSRNRLPLCPIESANATDGQDLAGSELARRLQLHGVGQHP
jgi:hypothetical protein